MDREKWAAMIKKINPSILMEKKNVSTGFLGRYFFRSVFENLAFLLSMSAAPETFKTNRLSTADRGAKVTSMPDAMTVPKKTARRLGVLTSFVFIEHPFLVLKC